MLCILLQYLSGALLPCPLDPLADQPSQPRTLSDKGLSRKEYVILDYLVQMHLAPKN